MGKKSNTLLLTLITLIALLIALYATPIRASLLFMGSVLVLIGGEVITVDDFLAGFANKQIVTIFLLVMVSIGLKRWVGEELLTRVFKREASPRNFLWQMMATVGSLSAVLNNTPIVAFAIPMVRDWCRDTGHSPSRFLMPLAYITTLGGMITVVGTSTNLVLNGLIMDHGQPGLSFTHFLYPGLAVFLIGMLYLYTIGYRLLPQQSAQVTDMAATAQQYIIETRVKTNASIAGQTVEEAGLRHLKDMFLVELVRGDTVITPVSPREVIQAGDTLFFAGNTDAIYDLIKKDNGIVLPDQHAITEKQHFHFAEAVVPVNSTLDGKQVKDTNFRNIFNASIVAIRQRDGVRITEGIGHTVLHSGDVLLLLSAAPNTRRHGDLLFLSQKDRAIPPMPSGWMAKVGGVAGILLLMGGISGVLDLFIAAILSIMVLYATNLVNYKEIKESIDLDMLILLVASLAIGTAILNAGLGDTLSDLLLGWMHGLPILASVAALFATTVLLTSIITNVAAVAMMFPVALAMSEQLSVPAAPFFVTIAFGASCAFLTPISYQTNLMVMGPGNYTFRDYFRVGLPLTLVYGSVVMTVVALMFGI
ncbi:MAG: SLC13 family permease [Saprospiraceae bacterium]